MKGTSDFEFKAPQFIENLENANGLYDDADKFFDAVDFPIEGIWCKSPPGSDIKTAACVFNMSNDTDLVIENKIAAERENLCSLKNKEEDKSNRFSLKRKASPLKDRNLSADQVSNTNVPKKVRRVFPALLPTIAESPVFLTSARIRPKPLPVNERVILKPVRHKTKHSVCIKPLPKPPTIPEPFNLTETGRKIHNCLEDSRINTTIATPGRVPAKKKRLETKDLAPFSLYERGLELMKRKREERKDPEPKEFEKRYEFRAKSPTVLRKEPFRPEFTSQYTVPVGPQLSTEAQANIRRQHENRKRDTANQTFKKSDNLALSAPKFNSSFLSTASSTREFCFNASVVSSISTSSSLDKTSMPFSFYERDMKMLARKKERMEQIETPSFEFKAREPSVLKKEAFWPDIESRTISLGKRPKLSTEKRAKLRKVMDQKKKERDEKRREDFYKAEQEMIRNIRKTMEFKRDKKYV